MSRPHRILVPGVFVVAALAFSSCVGTIYDRTYSNRKNYYKPAKERLASADAIMGAIDKKQPDANTLLDGGAPPPGGPAGLPPADGGVPGLPPPGAPDAGAPAGAPGGAPAPAAGAIPGLPPATPPAAGTPPPPPPK